ncbi:Ldh family oxidoreductase [bacterium]|nr:Ldh family oxidoreductase [bacterium]
MGKTPPKEGIRIPAPVLQNFIAALFQKAGTTQSDADLLADLLVATDLRGVHSHGTHQTPGYTRMMRDGRVNPRPNIKVASETTTARVYDGDGGMGHFPCHTAMNWVAATALEYGTAAATTRNHFHFGSAGKYTRMAAARGCIGIAVSSHRYDLPPEALVKNVNATSPISIGFPNGEQPPLVLDMGAHMLPWDEAIYEQMPFAFFKELGIGAINRALGGVLAGIYLPQFIPPQSPWESNQGAFLAAFDVRAFMPLEEFQAQMDAFVAAARNMQPFPGTDQAELPGNLEWQRERDYIRDGLPIEPGHQQALSDLGAELGVESPFAQYEHQRFGAE